MPRPLCEDCGLKTTTSGLPAERRARWCGDCAKAHAGSKSIWAIKRLIKELKQMTNAPCAGITAGPADGFDGPFEGANLLEWNAVIAGKAGTAYEGGIYRLNLSFPVDYPLEPPYVKMVTKMFHPRAAESGGRGVFRFRRILNMHEAVQ